YQPPPVLDRDDAAAARGVDRAADDDSTVAVQRRARQSRQAAGVGYIDTDPFLDRLRIAELGKPLRGSRTPTGGVHHQVGGEHILTIAWDSGYQPYSANRRSVGRGRQAGDGARSHDRHVRPVGEPLPDP